MNGNEPDLEAILKATTGLTPPAFKANPSLVNMAQRILNDVLAGRITSMAACVVAPTGEISAPQFGTQVPELILGTEFMRDDMKAHLRNQANRIIKPTG